MKGKVDFHLHSYASNVTDYYAANAFRIPESYSRPRELYQLLKQRGMTLVTLTDHNSIDGVLELLEAGYQDVFISAEMTTTFPEDGCNIHVTVANMSEAQFKEIKRLRKNIYEMIAYVDAEIAREAESPNKLAYFMTHPLVNVQNRPYGREGSLGLVHIEKALLLCNAFEVHNGSRPRALFALTERLLRSLDRDAIERLANRHDLAPKGPAPWVKSVVGGSDDHSGINPGRAWTAFDGETPNALVEAIRGGDSAPGGAFGGPITLANSMLKLLYDGSQPRNRAGLKPVALGGPAHALLQLVFDKKSERWLGKLGTAVRAMGQRLMRRGGVPKSFEALLEREVYALLGDAEFRTRLAETSHTDARIFLVVGTLVNRVFAHYVGNLRENRVGLVGTIKELVALFSSNLFVSLPYFLAFIQQSADSLTARDVRKAFHLGEPQKLVLFTDTFFEINGVSATIKRMIREAMRRDIAFTVVTCLGPDEYEKYCNDPEIRHFMGSGRLKIFTAVANVDFPRYDGLQVRFPPLLDLLNYLQESGCTKVQISTPGVIGLTGLLAAKLLQLETAATYHTSIPEYVENYTSDVTLEAIAWKYMILFYHAVDEVLVPSKFIARLLHKRGLRNRALLILDRWVDVERFHPEKRREDYWQAYGLENAEALVKFVYVGRVGVEKNLKLMAEAYRKLRETRQDAHLIIIGDGPYRRELEDLLAGLPVTFTGFIEGDALARAVASADVKLFASVTDTWGNAPLEAQASGLPVVVSDVGGPAELMQDGVTGFRVPCRDVTRFYEAMVALMDPGLRAEMGRAARAFAEANRVDAPFTAVLDAEAYRRWLGRGKAVFDLASATDAGGALGGDNVRSGDDDARLEAAS